MDFRLGLIPPVGVMGIRGSVEIMKKAKVFERRERPRVKNKWPVTLVLSDSQIEGEVDNISPIGAFISLKESPPLAGSFRLVIKPPNRQTLNVTAEVIWTAILAPEEEEPRIGVGVRFLDISKSDSQFLHDLVASFYIV